MFLRACLAIILFGMHAAAQDWSQFRGPNSDGLAPDAQLPLNWSADQRVAWKKKIPGIGWSQPVTWGDKIFLTTAESDEQARPDPKNRGPGMGGFAMLFSRVGMDPAPPEVDYRWKLLCLDATTGNVVWDQVAREGRPTMSVHANNTYASETPVTDGGRVIAYFGMAGVYCYDMAGQPLWEKDLGAYPMQFGWGTGSSPILFGDFVYIQCDNDQASFLVALDKNTGDEAWRVERDEKSNWSTPYIWKNKLRTELVAAGGNRVRSYDPKTGALLWEMKGSGRTATTPVGDADLVYVDSYDRLTGGSGVFAAIRPGGSGDISLAPKQTASEHVAWSMQLRGYRIASPLLYDGCLYILEQSGVVRCLDAATGKEHYRKRVPGAKGFTASPIAHDGKVYFVDSNCTTIVIEHGPELRVVATNELDEMCWASPAVAGKRLLLRTVDHLYAVGND